MDNFFELVFRLFIDNHGKLGRKSELGFEENGVPTKCFLEPEALQEIPGIMGFAKINALVGDFMGDVFGRDSGKDIVQKEDGNEGDDMGQVLSAGLKSAALIEPHPRLPRAKAQPRRG